ncbi:MAG: MATE family efflux transporter [Lachnospiraceae bacterium]|nr:MATE family efflux transporter [Lachnospiraceae bacterium]
MSSNIKNMTEGKPSKLIFTFAIPLMAGNIFQQLYTVVDTMVVGKFLGVDALAALGASDWLNWMMLGIIQGFAQGFAIKMAQDFGAGDYKALRKTIGNSVLLAVLFAILLVICGELIAKPILQLLQTPEEILSDSLLYISIMFLGTPIVMAYNLLACILRSLGDSKTPLYAMIVASITNIVLDVLFVFSFKWGIAGAAVATLIAQLLSSVYCFYYLRKIEIVKLSREDFLLQHTLLRKLLYLGFPMAFQNAIIAVGGMVVQFVVNGFGVIFIAGFTATNKLYGLLEIAATSYGYAVVTYVGQNLGAKRWKRISEGMRASLIIAIITSVLIGGIMLLFGKFILSGFISGTPTEVEQALQIAYFYLAIMSICLPVLYLLHVVRSGLQGLGNTLLPMLSGVAEFVMRVGTALLLPIMVGEVGIFFAEIAAWAGADVVLVVSWFGVTRHMKRRFGEIVDNKDTGLEEQSGI